MAAPTTTDEALLQSALGPASVTNSDGQSVSSKDVDQIIKADQYAAAKSAVANSQPHFGLRFTKMKNPGAGC